MKTLKEVKQALGYKSSSSIYIKMKEGTFPRPIKLKGRLVWRDEEVDLMVEAILNELSVEQIKQIVVGILRKRENNQLKFLETHLNKESENE